MKTTPLEPFGLQIEEVDVGRLPLAQVNTFRRLISRARVAVFRHQRVDDAAFIRFLGTLGDLTFTEGEIPVPGAPKLNLISNVGRSVPPRSVFHTDTSYVECPPSFTALRAVSLADTGGATLFSDQVSAATNLPGRVRDWLNGRTVLHKTSGTLDSTASSRHPLLRRHPDTKEVALYLSTPQRCSALSETDECTSERVIRTLYRRSIRPCGLYSHEWQPGDVVVWDNRVTMHRADHHNVTGARILHRGLVTGERPIAV